MRRGHGVEHPSNECECHHFEDLGEALPDLLVKLRVKATRKQVAEVAGIRPIRLKELETGVEHPAGLKTLDKVLKVYASASVWPCRPGTRAVVELLDQIAAAVVPVGAWIADR